MATAAAAAASHSPSSLSLSTGWPWARYSAAAAVVTLAALVALAKYFPQTADERVQEIIQQLDNHSLSIHHRLALIEELQAFDLTHSLARTLLRTCTDRTTHPEVQSTLLAVLCTYSEKEKNAPILLEANALDHLLSVLESDVALQATYLSATTAVYDLVHGNPAAKKRVIEAGIARAMHRRLSSRSNSELTELLLTLSVRLLISYEANITFIRHGCLGDVVRVFTRTKRRSVKERCLNLIAIMTTFLTASPEGELVPAMVGVFRKYRIEKEIIMIVHFDDPINTPWCLLILKNMLLLDLVRLSHPSYPSLFSDLLRLSGLNDDLRVIAGHTLILLLHHDPTFTDALTIAFPYVIEDITTVVHGAEGKCTFLELVLFGLEHNAPPLMNQYRAELRGLADYCASSEFDDVRLFAGRIEVAMDVYAAEVEAHVAMYPVAAEPTPTSSAPHAQDDRDDGDNDDDAGSQVSMSRKSSGGRGRVQRAKEAAVRVFRSSTARGRRAVASGASSRASSTDTGAREGRVRGIVVLDDAPPVPPLPLLATGARVVPSAAEEEQEEQEVVVDEGQGRFGVELE
ncbi:hypothetical protein BCR44DRAFT_1461107 [Catenaria anguillulae PL171]|uniref:Uncharacterized protein n=1 Tax=Catenaria anguillulae PL171 TaxID=765915 RepID=A0A1Y2HNR6_9FUNG|nr:hypothetical protein BCR44DRAFT_1461107 [Catenaria anguillulae PL171]